jgi:hypothetical protein
MYSWAICGLDTLETITIEDDGRKALPLELCGGPKVWPSAFGRDGGKTLYLYPEHLKLLYERFKNANPKGVVLGPENSFDEYAPPELTEKELERLEAERKIFVDLFLTDEDRGYPHARRYLPELFEPETIDKMASDPWLNAHLLGKAVREGTVPSRWETSDRWSPEWRAYCDRLIASGEYK